MKSTFSKPTREAAGRSRATRLDWRRLRLAVCALAVDLDSITPSQGSCGGTSAITCALGQLSSGATATVTIVVIPQRLGTIRSAASVTSGEPEPNQANNSVTLDTPVVMLSYLPLVGKATDQ